MTEVFARQLLRWFDRHGRHDLPWQREASRYRVWVSEIMLQQTQVGTVVDYFNAFVKRFPDAVSLAAAPLDEVLHAWSGLGYYARARNLHRAARIVCERHGGELPASLDALVALPGIGRSTAGAILALADGAHVPILDGNVKRVLTRYHGIEGWPGRADIERRLWRLAERHTPRKCTAAYTQAIMDLGAGICTRSKPNCPACPVAIGCLARQRGLQGALPTPRPRRDRPVRNTVMLIAQRADGALLLERRPPSGIWGGLWCFPSFEHAAAARRWCRNEVGAARFETRPPLRHAFTHFELSIEPLLARVARPAERIAEPGERLWYDSKQPRRIGLAAPVAALIESIAMPLPIAQR